MASATSDAARRSRSCGACTAETRGDAATAHIAGLRLKTYYAGPTKITDRSLETAGAECRRSSASCSTRCQGITDAGVRALTRLPRLREVAMEGSRNVTRAAAAGFAPRVRVQYSTI